jgi:hypothetical protein
MKLPAFVVGTHASVKRECRARAKKLARGAAWEEVIGDDRVDTADFDGLIVLGRRFTQPPGVHAYVYAPFDALLEVPRESLPPGVSRRDFADQAFEPTLRDAATLPFLLGCHYRLLFAEPGPGSGVTPEIVFARHVPFVRALLREWDSLWSVGARYLEANPPTLLTELPTTIQYVLCHCGIDPKQVNARLTNEGFPALAAEVLDRFNQ